MRKQLILASLLFLSLAADVATSATVTIYATKDCVCSSYEPSVNQNSDALTVGMVDGFNFVSLVQFNLSTIPSGADIQSATLCLNGVPGMDMGLTNMRVRELNGSWSETSVTWNNKPSVNPSGATSSIPAPHSDWDCGDVTSQVTAWHSGARTNYGFLLDPSTPVNNQFAMYYNREVNFNPPYLRVEYTVNVAPTIIVTQPSSNISVGQGDVVTIGWNGTDPDDAATVALFWDSDCDFDNGGFEMFAWGLPEDGNYPWDTDGVPLGTYRIHAVIDDQNHGADVGTDCADGSVTITIVSCEPRIVTSPPDPMIIQQQCAQKTTSSTLAEERDSRIKRKPDFSYPHSPNQLIVKFDQGQNLALNINNKSAMTGVHVVDDILRDYALSDVRYLLRSRMTFPRLKNAVVLTLESGSDLVRLANELFEVDVVDYVEPNYAFESSATPNDPEYSIQWALSKISAPAAWNISTGSSGTIIGIIDTGIDWDHPDLSEHIWSNSDEIPDNGLDDDNNGYIDDIRGWDFQSVTYGPEGAPGEDVGLPDNDPMDRHGHGSHCAGISAAVTNNGTGIAGLAWNCTLMPLRFAYKRNDTGAGVGYDVDAVDAFQYAADNGAKVLNFSFTSYGMSSSFVDAVQDAYDLGVVIAVAAANDNKDDPGAIGGLEETIAVANTNNSDQRNGTSNYGSWIDVSAPGTNILSTVYDDQYATWSGTSMAAPYVAGLAALVLSVNPSLTPGQVTDIIKNNADNIDGQNPGFVGLLGTGRINASAALQNTPGGANSILVSNTATGNPPCDLTVNISEDCGWLNVSPMSFAVPVSSSQPVMLEIDWNQVGCSEKSCVLTITSNDAFGNSSIPYTIFAVPCVPPTFPAGLTCIPGSGTVSLSWTHSQGATAYCIQRDYEAPICGITGNSWTDNDPGSSARCYRVKATNGYCESEYSAQVCCSPSESYTIAGHTMTSAGAPIAGVIMSGLPCSPTPTTDANGYYSCQVSNGWSGSVTPNKSGCTFSPPSRSYMDLSSNQVSQDYTGSCQLPNTYIRLGCPVSKPVVDGDSIGIPIFIRNDFTIGGMSLGFAYSSSDIEVTSVQQGPAFTVPDGFGVFLDEFYPEENKVLIGWINFTPSSPMPIHENEAHLATFWVQVPVGTPSQCVDFDSAFCAPAGFWTISPSEGGSMIPGYTDCGAYDLIVGDADCLPTATISGYVLTATGDPIVEAQITGLPCGPTPTSDANGYYSCEVTHGWSGSAVPSKEGCSFTPPFISFSNVTSDQNDQNFLGDCLSQSETVIHAQGQIVGSAVNQCDVTIGIGFEDVCSPAPPPPPEYTVSMQIWRQDWSGPCYRDIRPAGDECLKWIIEINPHGNMPPPSPRCATITWNPGTFVEEGYYTLYEDTDGDGEGDVVVVSDMRTTNEYEICSSAARYFVVSWCEQVTHVYDLRAGWNLISMPVMPISNSVSELFPSATVCFEFDGVYEPATVLETCRGYWLKVPTATSVSISGVRVADCTSQKEPGWHLVGGPYCDVAPYTTPAGCIQAIFGFDSLYQPVTQLEPGSGYWIKITCSSQLSLSCSSTPQFGGESESRGKRTGEITLRATGQNLGGVFETEITIGIASSALSLEAPPKPPSYSVSLESFREGWTGPFYQDVRLSDSDENYWIIAVNPHGDIEPPSARSATLSWDPSQFYDQLYCLREGFERDSPILITDMRTATSLDIFGGDESKYYLIEHLGTATSVDTTPTELPSRFELQPCYPNPFNPQTTLSYSVPFADHVRLTITDILGREVITLVDQLEPAGTREVTWDGRDKTGARVASGVYFYQMVTKDFVATRKMVLLK